MALDRRGTRFALLALASALALVPRLHNLEWGLVHGVVFPDEAGMYGHASRLNTERPLFLYPHGHLHVLHAVRNAVFGSEPDVLPTVVDLVAVGRLVSVAFSVATVWVTYAVGAVSFSHSVGILAAVLLAVTPYHAAYTHHVSLDVPVTLWVMASLLFATVAAKRNSLALCIPAALLAGVAAGTKYNAVVVLAAPLVVVARAGWAMRGPHGWNRGNSSTQLLGAAVSCVCAALAGFVITTPACVVHLDLCMADATHMLGLAGSGNANTHRLDYGSLVRVNYIYQLVVAFPFSLGLPTYVAALVGLARHGFSNRNTAAVVLSCFAVLYPNVADFEVSWSGGGRYRVEQPEQLLLDLWTGRHGEREPSIWS